MILVVNAGSSSIKVELFDMALSSTLTCDITGIGGAGRRVIDGVAETIDAPDHAAALDLILRALDTRGHGVDRLEAAGHRIVHGGATLTAPARLQPDIIDRIAKCTPLAPLHNPHNLAAIHALAALAPDLPQVGVFDTAFHATNPDVATTYALPADIRAQGIRRYGFHGLSYASMVHGFGPDLPPRLLAFHLGNGASLCAIHNGVSVATSMGYSPLDGLTMGTRTGSIDGMAVLRLAEEHGTGETARILNRQSGLKGLAGTNDMATLLKRSDAEARFAVEHFCYWAARHGAGAAAAMGGADALAFTGGIGENAPDIRNDIADRLAFLGPLPVHVVAAEEERLIAREIVGLL